jgi:hypothetical protein
MAIETNDCNQQNDGILLTRGLKGQAQYKTLYSIEKHFKVHGNTAPHFTNFM